MRLRVDWVYSELTRRALYRSRVDPALSPAEVFEYSGPADLQAKIGNFKQIRKHEVRNEPLIVYVSRSPL